MLLDFHYFNFRFFLKINDYHWPLFHDPLLKLHLCYYFPSRSMPVCQRASPCHRPHSLVDMLIPKARNYRSSCAIVIRCFEFAMRNTKIIKVYEILHDEMFNNQIDFRESITVYRYRNTVINEMVTLYFHTIGKPAFCMLLKWHVILLLLKALKKQMICGWGSFRFRCKQRMHNSRLIIWTQLVEHVITCGVMKLVKGY